MRRVSSISIGIVLLFLIISICSVAFIIPDNALAQPCHIEFAKSAPGGGDTVFPFEATLDGGQPIPGFLTDGQESGVNFSSSAVLVELPLEGWVFTGVECDNDDGIIIDFTDNGITAECFAGDFSEAFCTFFNVQERNIPTLSEWGMIAAAAGLGLIGVYFALRKRKEFNY
jgi:hypothetical protein